ncbi:outer membrane protein transport protein [bacterium]|nr:outer membrane protein transport protein [bacterium]
MKRSIFLTMILFLCITATSAFATNGHFSHGIGTKSKAMAGAGVALALDSLAAGTNPAAMVFVGSRWDFGVALFNPNREYTVTGNPSGFPGTFGLAPGTYESDSNYFVIPSLGVNLMLSDKTSLGLSMYGLGGMNTNYPFQTFGFSPTGVDFAQLFMAPTISRKLSENHAIGASFDISYQRFRSEGLRAFSFVSSSPTNLTDNGHENSYGLGVRVGYLGNLSEHISIGGAYQTEMKMSSFDKYSGLFAEQGDLDTPATWTAGVAIKPNSTVTFALDVQQILYSGINSINDPLSPADFQQGILLGDDNGAGFGWDDMTIVKLGTQIESGGGWTWRGGYSHGNQPIPESEVLFNILAPAVIEDHLTFGFTKELESGKEISFSLMRALSSSVTGPNPLEVPGQQTIELEMNQWEFDVSFGF